MSEGNSINEIGQIFTKTFLLMNYPYSSFILEAQRAKQRLARVFQARPARHAVNLSLTNVERAPARNDQLDAANRPRVSPEISRPRVGPNGSYWRREDMGALSFTLTLLLLGTVAAAQTDQPGLWLLVGPAPLAVGLAAVAFLRRRFNLLTYLRGLRARSGQSRERPTRVVAHRGSCQCQSVVSASVSCQ
jgi:hypothetical protein